jgi:hypothetical protein
MNDERFWQRKPLLIAIAILLGVALLVGIGIYDVAVLKWVTNAILACVFAVFIYIMVWLGINTPDAD